MVFFENHGMSHDESFQVSELTDFSFPPHFHRAYELIYVKKGELYVRIDKKEYTLEEQDLVFIFPSQFHEFRSNGHSDILIIIFAPELIGDFYNEYKSRIPQNNLLHVAELASDKLTSVYRQKSFLYQICSQLTEQTSFQDVQNAKHSKIVYQILLYIEKNYRHECSLRGASKTIGYDYVYLSKLFSRLMKMSFTEYLNRYRMLSFKKYRDVY